MGVFKRLPFFYFDHNSTKLCACPGSKNDSGVTLWLNLGFLLKIIWHNFANQSIDLAAFYEGKPGTDPTILFTSNIDYPFSDLFICHRGMTLWTPLSKQRNFHGKMAWQSHDMAWYERIFEQIQHYYSKSLCEFVVRSMWFTLFPQPHLLNCLRLFTHSMQVHTSHSCKWLISNESAN